MIPSTEQVGVLIKRARRASGKSQGRLAERLAEVSGNTGVTREQINRWENHRRIPGPFWREHLSLVLDIPLDRLDEAAAITKATRGAGKQRESAAAPVLRGRGPASSVASHDDEDAFTLRGDFVAWGELMLRREFLAGVGAVAGLGLSHAPLGHRPSVAISDDLVTAHRQLHVEYGRLENLQGPLSVLPHASDHHRHVAALYAAGQSGAARRQLGELVAVTAGFIGWLSFDLGRFGEAASRFHEASTLAAEMGDVSSSTYNLGQESRALAEAGFRQEALALVSSAIDVAGTAAHPAVRTWLHAVRSYHSAGLGDHHAALDDLAQARTWFGRVDTQELPTYIGYLDAANIAKWTTHTLTRLIPANQSSHAAAESALDDARSTWPSTMARGYGELLTGAARLHLLSGDLDQAAAEIWRAYELAGATGSLRNQHAALRLRGELEPYRGTVAVRDLDQRLLAPVTGDDFTPN